MSDLPEGWVREELGLLSTFVMGQAPPGQDCNKEGRGTPFVKAGEFGPQEPLIREWTTNPLKLARKEDVLVCVVGATCGKLNFGADCAIGRSVAAIRPAAVLDRGYLHSYLSTLVERLRAESVGSAQGVISKEELARILVPLPPASEQRRIIEKISCLSARSRQARNELEGSGLLIDKFKQAVLTRVFAHGSSLKVNLSELVADKAPVRYGVVQPGEVRDAGVLMVRVCDLVGGSVSWPDVRRIGHHIDAQYAAARVVDGDILISVVGTIGRIAVVSGMSEPTNIARAIVRLRPDTSKVNARWLALRLQAADCQRSFASDVREVARKTLNVSLIKEMQIALPNPAQQARDLRRIEHAFAAIDRLAADAQSACVLLDKLDQALLAKAFRGELVPQDPNDEPASVLLERILAEHASTTVKPRGRKPRAAAVET